MVIKLVFLLILGTSASVWAYTSTSYECGPGPEYHNLVLGRRESGDRLLFMSRLSMPRDFLRVQTYDFNFPRYSREPFHHISRIEVLDQLHDGTGGCAYLLRGGLGMNYLRLYMETQRGGSFDFHIRIYGR